MLIIMAWVTFSFCLVVQEVTLPIYFDREMANVKAKVSKKVLSYIINTFHNKSLELQVGTDK